MKNATLILAGFVLSATPALARSDTDYPHRDWGQVVTLDMTLAEATACIAREMRRHGPILVLPVTDGSDIDFTPGGLFQPGGMEPWISFKVRQDASLTQLRIFYRRPVITKGINGYMKKLQKQCLRVSKVEPA